MKPEAKVVYDLLVTDANVTALLPLYRGVASIFDSEAPQDAVLPYVVFGEVVTMPWDTHSDVGFETDVDVRFYVPRRSSIDLLNQLIEAGHAALHRQRPGPQATRHFAGTWVLSGPNALPVEENAIGRLITVRIHSYKPQEV